MKVGTLLTVPRGSYTNFYPQLCSGESYRFTDHHTILVLQEEIPRQENWVKGLLSDGNIGYVCTIGLVHI